MADVKKSGALAAWVKNNGAVVSAKARAAALARVAEERGTAGGGDTDYLTFSGQGARYKGWTLGRDKQTPDPENIYVVDPDSIVMGWTCWMNGKPVKKHRWGMYEIDKSLAYEDLDLSLEEGATDGDGWKEMIGFAMFDIDNPDKRIVFETTSASGVNSVRDLVDQIKDNAQVEDPDVPVIKLDDDTFESKAGKVNGKPLFPVQCWVTSEEVHAFLSAGDDRDPETLMNGGYAAEEEAPAPKPAARTPRKRTAA